MVKKGYYGIDGLSLAWDLGIIFFRRTKFAIQEVKKFFLKIKNFGLIPLF